MKIKKLLIKTKSKRYSIFVGKELTKDLSKILKSEKLSFDKCLIVLDRNVPKNIRLKIIKAINCKTKKIKILKPLIRFLKYFLKRILIVMTVFCQSVVVSLVM